MRVVRAAGQNVSPSDDGRLFDQIFSDGLFTDTTFTNLGGNRVQVGAMYGDLCGRDFTIEQMTLAVTLPEGEGESIGYIYVEIDTSSEDVISLNSVLAPFTPTYEDINTNGAVAQMILAEYTASAVAVTSVTAVYEKASASSVKAGSIATVETAQASESHSAGDYILLDGQLYLVTVSVSVGETFVEGTNVTAVSIGDELTALNAGLTQQWTEILPSTAISAGTNTTIPNIENYKELYIRATVANRATTIVIPVPDIISYGYINDHQYILSCVVSVNIVSGKISYAIYAQVAFASATTFRVIETGSNGYTGNTYFTIYAR